MEEVGDPQQALQLFSSGKAIYYLMKKGVNKLFHLRLLNQNESVNMQVPYLFYSHINSISSQSSAHACYSHHVT